MINHAVYIHVPFCRERCTYCAFNTYVDRNALIGDYVAALEAEMTFIAGLTDKLRVGTIYLGGGTPSLLQPNQIERILQRAQAVFDLVEDIEITMEANPGTVDRAYFEAVQAAGVNRLSLGAQSAHQHELSLFGRLHGWPEVEQAVRDARLAGVDNLSLDLIYGVPNQTLTMWETSLESALQLGPDHLSLYSLGLEAGTEMTRQVRYGELPTPDSDLAADMYDLATERLRQAGLIQYEISNWGKPGKFCRHNIQYWRNLPYLGLGAGAHGYASQTRTVNAMRPEDYIQRLTHPPAANIVFPSTPATIKAEAVDTETDQFETIFMGLRLLQEGLSLPAFAQRYGFRLETRFAEKLDWLLKHGLLRLQGDQLLLTKRARLISNSVFQHFMGEPA